MPKTEFVGSELYADWFRPQRFHAVLAAPALFDGSASAVLVTFRNRAQPDFEAADISSVGHLAGHFGRALGMRLDNNRLTRDLAAANAMLDKLPDAMLLVDNTARVRHANAAARTMLERGEILKIRHGRLEIRDPHADAALARIAAEGGTGQLFVRIDGGGGLIGSASPAPTDLGDAGERLTILRFRDPGLDREAPNPARLRERLPLSPRQSQALAEIANGATEAEAAAKLGLAEPTLHTHLRRAYAALDVNSRAELLSLLSRLGFATSGGPKKIRSL